jgi:hypothetical protein
VQFFFDAAVWQAELELYSRPELRKVMPTIYDAHGADGDDADAHCAHSSSAALNGEFSNSFARFRFPPALAIERGESLDEFAARVDHEPITVIQALVLIVKRVQVRRLLCAHGRHCAFATCTGCSHLRTRLCVQQQGPANHAHIMISSQADESVPTRMHADASTAQRAALANSKQANACSTGYHEMKS